MKGSTFDWQALDITLSGLQKHYRNGDFSPRQLVQHLLSLEQDDNHNIWITRFSEEQLQPYIERLDNAKADDLPLYGVPFAIKDNIDLAGVDTTAACEAFRYRPEQDATVVSKLISAGAIPMGKTNMDQFATGLVGVRSPWGAGKNVFNPAYISGGSSSGSAVSTAKGQVSFALGTDTAGSGRVPAMLNNLIGLKPSKGLISCRGVVPACQSLDCVSIFALTVDDANVLLAVAEGFDIEDPYSRRNVFDNSARRYGLATTEQAAKPITIGIPAPKNLTFYGDKQAEQLFEQAVAQFKQLGYATVEVDVSPLLDAAKLLYEGPWVAERYIAVEKLITSDPDAMLPVIQSIIGGGDKPTAADCFKAQYRLQAFKKQADQLLVQFDGLVMPTAPTAYTIEQVEQDPIKLNSQLGTYTNFMNLLDMAAVAVPAGFLSSGVGFGVTLMGPAFSDRRLLSLANAFCQETQQTIGALDKPLPPSQAPENYCSDTVDVVVCGAHLNGMPLNWQLTERGGHFLQASQTTPCYRLYAMADGRPALVHDDENGSAIEVEVWRLAKSEFGSFVADIPAPLGIGKCELSDGRVLSGFIAEPRATIGAKDITHLGGWRGYKASC